MEKGDCRLEGKRENGIREDGISRLFHHAGRLFD
jgi:hypothetical protein